VIPEGEGHDHPGPPARDFEQTLIKDEARPLILKENDGPAARPAAFLTHCAVGYERLDEYVQQLKGKEGDS